MRPGGRGGSSRRRYGRPARSGLRGAPGRRAMVRSGSPSPSTSVHGLAVGHGWVPGGAGRADAATALAALAAVGVRTFEVTAIDRDGLLGGPGPRRSTSASSPSVVARSSRPRASPRSTISRASRALGCAGAIVGRALYDGRLTSRTPFARPDRALGGSAPRLTSRTEAVGRTGQSPLSRRGGPASIRRRVASTVPCSQSASIHHVAPAAAHGSTSARAAAGIDRRRRTLGDHLVRAASRPPGGAPPPNRGRRASSAGDHSTTFRRPCALWPMSPSQRAARVIERSFGHEPTTQIGMRGRWTGVGRKVIGANR